MIGLLHYVSRCVRLSYKAGPPIMLSEFFITFPYFSLPFGKFNKAAMRSFNNLQGSTTATAGFLTA